MTHRTLAVVSAGLSQPSSTRLLADQLADATRDALQADGSTVDVVVIELRDLAHDIVNNLITGFPSPVLAKAISQLVAADGVSRLAAVQRVVQRVVQVVLRRARP
jgi:FMN reductase